jgi:hypothetical protein
MHWLALTVTALVAPRTTPAPEVVWIDLAGVPAAAQEAARREAMQTLQDVGISPAWRVGSAQELLGAHDLPVVLLKRDQAARRGADRVLGACTPRSDTPRAWVYLDNLAWTLGLTGHEGPLTVQQTVVLGRAIGRIVAHEVIHAVAPALGHAGSGIMSPRFRRADLLAHRLPVDGATRRGLLAVLAAARASSLPPRS